MVEIDGSSDVKGESLMEKIEEKIHGHDSSSSSSSSDSETEKKSKPVTPVKNKIYRLFGRERPVHKVLGGRKPADIFLWRNKKISAAVLGGVTAIWVLFELLEYHLLTLVCHILMVSLALLFLWANASSFINKSPPRIPDVRVSEDIFLEVATALQIEINGALAFLRDVGSGRDLKKFLAVIAGLWVLSLVGSCGNFLTLFYICFLLLHTMPVFYEKYDHQIDACAEKAMIQIKRQYALFDAKVLSKIPRGKPKNKKA